MKLDQFNIKARFRRAQTLLHMGLKEETRQDILEAIRFDPCNEELNRELSRIESLCYQSREKDHQRTPEFIDFEPLSLTSSDANLNIGIPGMSMGSFIITDGLYENNSVATHIHFEPLDVTFNEKKREYALEEQSDMSLSYKFHQIVSIGNVEEIHENQIMSSEETSISEISSCSSIIDVDWDGTKCESTLTSMSCMEANGFAESTKPKSHCSINMHGKLRDNLQDFKRKCKKET
ncbi:LOW QUALITY PROTEIN: hypothetical protein Cgig2_033700 [Carnegiea gigantea]|uniref:Uncharacterized protein n=1 Tax=Carnegiea gigantea TaxID=171969 RepID=A0A9Q1QDB1_9CARY|nr:LOW QUALITY PROTEIN: hypothetical protein Cgig2_033700 [Carnegiea gigantea]